MTSHETTLVIIATAILVYILVATLIFLIRWGMTWRMRCQQACFQIDQLMRELERLGGHHGTAA
jgi:hypothetical protein